MSIFAKHSIENRDCALILYWHITLHMKKDDIHFFDSSRDEFKPYGLTCEKWVAQLMNRFDQHNEIELNFFPSGSCTYLLYDKIVRIPSRRLTIFWGLTPHQIIDFQDTCQYYVCTIPLSLFLNWEVPSQMVDNLFAGQMLYDPIETRADYDEYLFKQWLHDMNSSQTYEPSLTEMKARVIRLGQNYSQIAESRHLEGHIHHSESKTVAQIALFIAQNYMHPIKTIDIAKNVGLHPDYANSIFKKAFGVSLHQHVTNERINHAQRLLLTTDCSIADIAWSCGFNTISRFNSAFLKLNGCTPREYRKSMDKGFF
jgi:AraC-like DNA-binding protein